MKLHPHIKMTVLAAVYLLAGVKAGNSWAGDPGSFVRGVIEAPPESQILILKLLFDDMYSGTTETLKAKFINACNAGKESSDSVISSSAVDAVDKSVAAEPKIAGPVKSKEAVLAGLCTDAVRTRIEAVLTQLISKTKSAASASNPAITSDAPKRVP